MDELEEEFLRILKALNESGALKSVILIGSWVLYLYGKTILEGKVSTSRFRTRDLDFSVHSQNKRHSSSPKVRKVLADLGYQSKPKGVEEAEEFQALEYSQNELSIEFLASRTRDDKPYFIADLGVIACPLRFQDVLFNHTLEVEYHSLQISVPDPVIWAMHKIAISQLRRGKDREFKMANDIEGANTIISVVGEEAVLEAKSKEGKKFISLFDKGWKVRQSIDKEGDFS